MNILDFVRVRNVYLIFISETLNVVLYVSFKYFEIILTIFNNRFLGASNISGNFAKVMGFYTSTVKSLIKHTCFDFKHYYTNNFVVWLIHWLWIISKDLTFYLTLRKILINITVSLKNWMIFISIIELFNLQYHHFSRSHMSFKLKYIKY